MGTAIRVVLYILVFSLAVVLAIGLLPACMLAGASICAVTGVSAGYGLLLGILFWPVSLYLAARWVVPRIERWENARATSKTLQRGFEVRELRRPDRGTK